VVRHSCVVFLVSDVRLYYLVDGDYNHSEQFRLI